jgi:F0F1-type ATP synthase assembly protein I
LGIDTKWLKDYGDFVQMGLMFPASIAVGTAMGYFADRWLHTDPWGKLAGFVFGAFAAFYNFFKDYSLLMEKKKNESQKDKKDPGSDPDVPPGDPSDPGKL